jgi:hypothetical protein
MDKRGKKVALYIDVAALRDVVEAFENLQLDTFDTSRLTVEPEYHMSEMIQKKA